jgi:hypothetical protein
LPTLSARFPGESATLSNKAAGQPLEGDWRGCAWSPEQAKTDSPMSHKHINLLRTIFQDPISGNIHWREIESLLNHVGATIEPSHGARFRVVLNGIEGFLHYPHHGSTCSKQDIKLLREYLAHAGVTPSLYEQHKDGSAH